MSTKKEDILRMLEEGETVNNLVQMGYNKKYVKEVIRSINSIEVHNKQNEQDRISKIKNESVVVENDLIQMRKDINEIKRQLSIQNNIYTQELKSDNKIDEKKKQLEETLKILNFINENEQLLNYIYLNINISITDNSGTEKEEKIITQRFKDNIDIKVNPIDIYRQKGEVELKNILSNFDVNVLKDIARQYTPDARGYVYKWNDTAKIIDYIIERSSNLSEKGSVFVTD